MTRFWYGLDETTRCMVRRVLALLVTAWFLATLFILLFGCSTATTREKNGVIHDGAYAMREGNHEVLPQWTGSHGGLPIRKDRK